MEAFQYALSRYDLMQAQELVTQKATDAQEQASGISALAMMKQLFTTRDTLDPGMFIMEIIKLAFQSGASDIHFQSEEL